MKNPDFRAWVGLARVIVGSFAIPLGWFILGLKTGWSINRDIPMSRRLARWLEPVDAPAELVN